MLAGVDDAGGEQPAGIVAVRVLEGVCPFNHLPERLGDPDGHPKKAWRPAAARPLPAGRRLAARPGRHPIGAGARRGQIKRWRLAGCPHLRGEGRKRSVVPGRHGSIAAQPCRSLLARDAYFCGNFCGGKSALNNVDVIHGAAFFRYTRAVYMGGVYPVSTGNHSETAYETTSKPLAKPPPKPLAKPRRNRNEITRETASETAPAAAGATPRWYLGGVPRTEPLPVASVIPVSCAAQTPRPAGLCRAGYLSRADRGDGRNRKAPLFGDGQAPHRGPIECRA
jgi:hypothetical protein